VWRSDGAQAGELITVEHDLQMLEDMLSTTNLQGKDCQ